MSNINSLHGSNFIYDLDQLRPHAQQLAAGHAKLFYACKANPLSAVLSTLRDAGLRFDVASEGELRQVLSVGVPGSKIIMTGPAKPRPLVELALANQVATFVIESPMQLRLLQELANGAGYEPRVLLRLQLQWNRSEHSVLGGSQVTPFGMDLATAAEVLKEVRLPFAGFHVFQWGNILELKRLHGIWDRTIADCRSLTSDFEVLDVGGGLGIPYSGEQSIDWTEVDQAIGEFKQAHGLKEFWLELGRYLTGPCGVYMTRVVDRKRTYGKNLLVLAGGINHIGRSALVHDYFPVELARESGARPRPFAVCGPLCTALDFLGEHMLPEDVAIGDLLIFKQAGAYGFTESLPFFLCHELPGEAVVKDGKLEIVRPARSAQDWMK